MYRDVVQWSKIRHRILVQGRSIRRVASEKGIDPKTIRKMLDHALPQPRMAGRANRYPKLGPHTASIPRLLRENATLPPEALISIKDIYERVRDEEGFRGGYSYVFSHFCGKRYEATKWQLMMMQELPLCLVKTKPRLWNPFRNGSADAESMGSLALATRRGSVNTSRGEWHLFPWVG